MTWIAGFLAIVAVQLIALELGRRLAQNRGSMRVEYGERRRVAQGRLVADG